MEETARVVAVSGQLVTVEAQVKSSCTGCQQIDTCGSGQVAKAFPQKQIRFTAKTELAVNIDDWVVISIAEKQLLATAWQVYLWPLLGLIAFAGLGQWLVMEAVFNSEIYAIILGGMGGYAGFRFARFWQKMNKSDAHLQPKILSKVAKTTSVRQIDPIS